MTEAPAPVPPGRIRSRMMLIASFFNSWPGMYLAQTFLHSLVAAIIVDTALVAWKMALGRPDL